MNLSKSELDRLGSRLRNSEHPADEDLVLLNRYRERFIKVADSVVAALQELSSYPVEARPHKSIPSIVAKLRRRQPARLSAIQDIAGARVIVPETDAQDDLVGRICARFPEAIVDDKRARPAFGYRAVHIIVSAPLPLEIQVRTVIQHAWAQLSERLADQYGFELKYGGGPDNIRTALLEYADFGHAVEDLAAQVRKGGNDPEALRRVQEYLGRLPAIVETLRVT